MKFLFSATTILLTAVSLFMIYNYIKNKQNGAIKYLTLFILLHLIGFVGFILRNQIPDFLSIIVANGLFAVGTLYLYLAVKVMVKNTPIWQTRYLVPLFTYLIGFLVFTYIEYETSIRILIYYFFSIIYTSAIAWLFWFSESVKYRVYDRVSSLFFGFLSVLFLAVLFQTSAIKLQAYYFSNTNLLMNLSIIVMIAINIWTIISIKYRVEK